MSNTHPKYLGMAGLYGKMAASKAISKADLIVAAGVRFSDRGTGSREKFAQNAKVIHIDIDSAELGKVINAHLQIGGNLKKAEYRSFFPASFYYCPYHSKYSYQKYYIDNVNIQEIAETKTDDHYHHIHPVL